MSQQYENPAIQKAHDRVFKEGRTAHPGPIYPPGFTKDGFDDMIEELKSIIGGENVHTGETLLHFSDPFSRRVNNLPSAAVCPETTDQVCGILALANRLRFPLWTTSKGKNLGYGGPAPRVGGSVVLSLYRMKRILEVNEKAAFAVVEPGVSFFDLYEHCRTHKLAVWPSMPAIAWGSVLGNALDRGFGYTAFGDHQNHICGMEVLLPDGQLIRTGQWAADNAPSAFACKASFGPQVDGLFLQSNLGVVTKLGIWMQPQPEATMTVRLEMDKIEDLADLIEILAKLRLEDIINNDPSIFNVFRRISRLAPRHELYSGPGAMPESLVADLMKKHNLPYWTTWFSFYGSKEIVQSRLAITQKTINDTNPGARLAYKLCQGEDGARIDAEAIPKEWQPGNAGVPTINFATTIDYNTPPGGIGGHVDFSPILPYDGQLALKWFKAATAVCNRHGFDSFIGGHAFARHATLVHMILFNRLDEQHVQSATALWHELASVAKEHGLVNYRTHLDYMDIVQDTYDFNDNAYRRFVETLKDSLDPNGILAPGKSGIWPKAYRDLKDERGNYKN
ncbi:glycolate oxidase [Fusarium acuminatum]|uniref:Glycolate oxidase n=1 Tax=Fusarium acuminatum TaxID=5515 RepID=A0ABZ2WMU4_9HYPO